MSARWIRRIVLRLVFGSVGAVLVVSALAAAHGALAQNAQPLQPQVSVSSSATGAPQTLFATGVADLAVAQPPAVSAALSVSVSERSLGLDRDATVRAAIEKVAAVRSALEKAGVPSAGIVISNAGVTPIYGAGGPGIAPPLLGYSVTESLQVFGLSPDKFDAAIQTALTAGATNASRSGGGFAHSPQPDPSAISRAVQQAGEQARVMAQAGAQALGLTLGSIRSVQVQVPPPFTAPGVVPLRVSVSVAYDIRQP